MAAKLSGSLRERHCDGSLISVNFQILDFSTYSSAILGFTSAMLRLSLFIPTMGATGAARSTIVVPRVALADMKLPIAGVFTTAAEAALHASDGRFSTLLSNLIPSEFAKTLTLLSFVETASSIPSLLNLIHGEAGNSQSASIVVNKLALSMSQSLTMNSSPTAKNLFLVVSNCTTPTDRFPRPI
uniref:Uncharacterized protein n=1 Tax=Rhizophora mucronata TaxID=61149 RepID=A0A2P2LW27_RHIMU